MNNDFETVRPFNDLFEKLPPPLQIKFAYVCTLDMYHLFNTNEVSLSRVLERYILKKCSKEEVFDFFANLYNESKIYRVLRSLRIAIFNEDANSRYYAADAVVYTSYVLGVDLEIYINKLKQFIDNLTETEKLIYNIKL